MKKKIWTVAFSVLLTGLSIYIALDTFVIKRPYREAVEINTEMISDMTASDGTAPVADADDRPVRTGRGKRSGNKTGSEKKDLKSDTSLGSATVASDNDTNGLDQTVSKDDYTVNLSTYRVNDTDVYVADIELSSVAYLKTAFADNTYGRKITSKPSAMADENDAVLAINGDYYGARERGYVIRNGVIYRDTPSSEDVLCIYGDGHLEIIDPSEYTAEELLSAGVWQAFSFGPGLLEDGRITVDENDEVGRAMASNPRTVIGITEDDHYVFVVSDGRTEESEGLSLYEMAEFLQSIGVKTAYNLDGGGSSAMVYQGTVINHPTTGGSRISERSVSDIVYIG